VACQGVFLKLKDLLSSPSVLVYPNIENDLILHTDAIGEGSGAVLEQVQENGKFHPMTYALVGLSPILTAIME